MNALDELKERALALPKEQRLALAQDLWESLKDVEEGITEEELRQRLRDEPDSTWKNHADVMKQAQREFGWKGK